MANEPKRPAASNDADRQAEGGPTETRTWRWRRFLRWQWIVALAAAPLAVHAIGLTYCSVLGTSSTEEPPREVALGAYHFTASDAAPGPIQAASFDLHIALIDDVETAARTRLKDREHRVRQNIEELLRQAHGADFEDPSLDGLKRQLQEQINHTLEVRAISEVIITGLELKRTDIPATVAEGDAPAPSVPEETAESVSWPEAPPG